MENVALSLKAQQMLKDCRHELQTVKIEGWLRRQRLTKNYKARKEGYYVDGPVVYCNAQFLIFFQGVHQIGYKNLKR